MNAQQGPMTEAMYYVLLALTRPGHGYRLMGEVEKVSAGRISMGPGTLYGVLTRMKKEGLILLAEDDGRRKVYRITAAGREALTREYARLKAMVADGRQIEEDGDGQA
jgi:DNA-binding PadR family transcriptional regulator